MLPAARTLASCPALPRAALAGADWLVLSAAASAPAAALYPLPLVLRARSQGGLQEGLAVELANATMAVVIEATPEFVKLDANNPMSGKTLLFELEVLAIERPDS